METDHALIIPGMVDGIAKNCIAGSFLNSYEQLIISVFNSSPKKNLRILKQAINDFCHLYVLLSEKEVELDNNILEPLLIFIIAFSLEVKSNHIREELFINIRTLNDLKSTNMSYKFFQSQEAKDIALFFDRYFEKGKYYDCSFEVAKSFILTSLIDEEKFVVDYTDIMQSASLTIEEIFLSADFWTLTDDEFHKAHLSTYKMLELGNYDASNYLNALNYYSYYISIGAVDLTIEKLEADLICGLEKAVTKTTEKVNIGKLTEGYSELLKTEHGKKMILTYENINTRLTESRLANVETELIEAITMSDDFHLKALFEYNATVPIFKYTDIDKLSNTLLTTSNEKIVNFARLIRKRYNNKYPYLAEEVPNIEKLKVQLQVYIEANEKSLKVGLLKRLVDELTSCIVKI